MVEFLRGALEDALFLGGRLGSSLAHNASLAVLSLALALSVWLYVNDAQNPRQTDFVAGSVPITVVNVPAGRAVATLSDTAVSVRVSAPKSIFEDLTADDFTATLDLSAANARQVNRQVRVEPKNRRVHVVEVSPAAVEVTLENVTSRTVPVQVRTLGAPPAGFDLASASAEPASVTVSGPESLVQGVTAACAEVNLTNLRLSIDQSVTLKAQGSHCGDIAGVSLSPEDAKVSVTITQTVFTRAFVVNPVVRGQPASGYTVTAVSVEPPLVQVSAPLDVLSSIDAVRGVTTEEVNIAGAKAGSGGPTDVTRVVKLQLPQGATASRDDVTVRVTIAAEHGQTQVSTVVEVRGLAAGAQATVVPDVVRVILAGPQPALDALTPTAVTVYVDASGLGPGLHALNASADAPAGLAVVAIDPPQVGLSITQR